MIARLVGTSLVVAVAAAGSSSAGGVLRRHRLILPTPPLPHALAVDEREWAVVPSESVIAAGADTFQVYDRGQDAHNLTIQGPITRSGPGPIRGQAWLQSGGTATIVANLPAGTYKLYCSMFAGTPQSHEKLGMHALITVR
jgi:plastocyanin